MTALAAKWVARVIQITSHDRCGCHHEDFGDVECDGTEEFVGVSGVVSYDPIEDEFHVLRFASDKLTNITLTPEQREHAENALITEAELAGVGCCSYEDCEKPANGGDWLCRDHSREFASEAA